MKYVIKFEKYTGGKSEVLVIPNLEWKVAFSIADKISSNLSNWTRHISCSSRVLHMDNYHDLFNEGCVIISKQTSERLKSWGINSKMTTEIIEIFDQENNENEN